jgi:hypothetical protein
MISTKLTDGLYVITTTEICAGFIVKSNRIIRAAPIFRKWLVSPKGIAQLERLATRVCEGGCDDRRGTDNAGVIQEHPTPDIS